MYTVTIKELPALKLAVIEHQGSYLKIGQAFEKVFAISHQHNLLHNNTRAFGIYYDNPNEIPEKDLRAKAGITISDEDNPETGLSITTTASGKYATMIHTGAYSELENAYQWLYGVWLINSDEEPANAPVLEEYLNNPREVPAHQLKTAIYLPLK